ncbi:AAA family ATPase [Niveibacterium sp. SC-1]|uniref:AAA family ATPase n=1 Tax=Niveibacterium sp. SC-1 TaxID=3135646 RepID=UPI00311DAEEB
MSEREEGAPRFRRGLVVGKFSPLHLGHLALIRAARAACASLLVLSYCKPELPGCLAERRARWLARTCPDVDICVLDETGVGAYARDKGLVPRPMPTNDATDAEHQAYLAWLLVEVLDERPDAFFANEAYAQPTARVLSEACTRRGGVAHTVHARSPDPGRRQLPVSASQIRAQSLAATRWLPDAVRADYPLRVGLIGAESSGKTTLAAALARHFGTPWVPEYGRELWEAKGGTLAFEDYARIAAVQVAREEAVRDAALVFCDTTPLTTIFYCRDAHDRADPALIDAAARPYALLVLCEDDFAFEQDGTRRGADFSRRQQAWYRAELAARSLPWISATGALEARVAQVARALAACGASPLPACADAGAIGPAG